MLMTLSVKNNDLILQELYKAWRGGPWYSSPGTQRTGQG